MSRLTVRGPSSLLHCVSVRARFVFAYNSDRRQAIVIIFSTLTLQEICKKKVYN